MPSVVTFGQQQALAPPWASYVRARHISNKAAGLPANCILVRPENAAQVDAHQSSDQYLVYECNETLQTTC